MKAVWTEAERWRWTRAPAPYGSRPGDRDGAFIIPGPCNVDLKVIVSDALPPEYPWEHVSVSTKKRCPNWVEMDYVKRLFWDDHECVMQLHPPRSEHINIHPFCLHLWRPTEAVIPMPPSIMVGPDEFKEGNAA